MDSLKVYSVAIAVSASIACGGDETSTTSSGAGGSGGDTTSSSTTTASGGSGGETTSTGGGGSATGGSATGGSATGGSATGGDATGGTGGSGDGQLGCAEPGGEPCPDGFMCCSGVPYPPEGICHVDCPAVSDRNQKQSFASIDPEQMLERLAALRITEWSYRQGDAEVRHLGPMAQDFRAAFGLGSDDAHIHPIDAQGVSLSGVQALYARMKQLEAENLALRREHRTLEERLERLEKGR